MSTRNKAVEAKDLPYFEPGCEINEQNTNCEKDTKILNVEHNKNNSDLDEEDSDYDSGKTLLDRQGRPFEPMYHVLEEPEIPVSDTL